MIEWREDFYDCNSFDVGIDDVLCCKFDLCFV